MQESPVILHERLLRSLPRGRQRLVEQQRSGGPCARHVHERPQAPAPHLGGIRAASAQPRPSAPRSPPAFALGNAHSAELHPTGLFVLYDPATGQPVHPDHLVPAHLPFQMSRSPSPTPSGLCPSPRSDLQRTPVATPPSLHRIRTGSRTLRVADELQPVDASPRSYASGLSEFLGARVTGSQQCAAAKLHVARGVG